MMYRTLSIWFLVYSWLLVSPANSYCDCTDGQSIFRSFVVRLVHPKDVSTDDFQAYKKGVLQDLGLVEEFSNDASAIPEIIVVKPTDISKSQREIEKTIQEAIKREILEYGFTNKKNCSKQAVEEGYNLSGRVSFGPSAYPRNRRSLTFISAGIVYTISPNGQVTSYNFSDEFERKYKEPANTEYLGLQRGDFDDNGLTELASELYAQSITKDISPGSIIFEHVAFKDAVADFTDIVSGFRWLFKDKDYTFYIDESHPGSPTVLSYVFQGLHTATNDNFVEHFPGVGINGRGTHALGDINGDGYIDTFFIRNGYQKSSMLYLANSSYESFRQVEIPFAQFENGIARNWFTQIFDVNGDGLGDIVGFNNDDGSMALAYNSGDSQNFKTETLLFTFNGAKFSFGSQSQLANLDKDGIPEYVLHYKNPLGGASKDGIKVYWYRDTVWNSGFWNAPGAIDEIKHVDFDGDGQDELLVRSQKSLALLKLSTQNGSVTFTQILGVSLKNLITDAEVHDSLAISHAVVSLTDPSGDTYKVFTNSLGEYSFDGVPPGTYSLSAGRPGWVILPTAGSNQITISSTNRRLDFIAEYLVGPERPAGDPTNDPGWAKLWGLKNSGEFPGSVPGVDIKATKAWEITKGSPDQVVAVLDTGIDIGHPDLLANVWKNPKEVPNNGIDDDRNGVIDDVFGYDSETGGGGWGDTNAHGTHVAGIIAAAGNNGKGIVGVAPLSKLMLVQGTSPGRGFPSANLVRSYDYIARMKQSGTNIVAVNASYGGYGPCEQYTKDYLSLFNELGITFVAAAGNENNNNDTKPSNPASCGGTNLISVASIDSRGSLSSFSNFGVGTVDLAAPGDRILSTVPNGGYILKDGTSMAAPYVTGVVALLKSREPNLSPSAVRQRLLDTISPLSQLNGRLKAAGIVNAYQALKVSTQASPQVPPSQNSPTPSPSIGNSNPAPSTTVGRNAPLLMYHMLRAKRLKGKTVELKVSNVLVGDLDQDVAGVQARIFGKGLKQLIVHLSMNRKKLFEGKVRFHLKGIIKSFKVELRAVDSRGLTNSVIQTIRIANRK